MDDGVTFLAGIGARDDFSGGAIREANAMNAKSVVSVGQRYIAAP